LVQLVSDPVFPLAKNQIPFTPFATASVFKASSMTYCMGIKITTSSGVVFVVKNKDNEEGAFLGNIQYKILYAADGRCVLWYSEKMGKASTNNKLQVRTMNSVPPKGHIKDWDTFNTAQDKNYKDSTIDDDDSIYAVCQWVLPFKVMKDVTESDYYSLYERKTNGHALSLLMWHFDQSGRNATKLKSSVFAVDSEDEEAEEDE